MKPLATCDTTALPPNHVVVQFGANIPSEVQGPILLWMEKRLRLMGIPAEVLKHTMSDDSRLRLAMTSEKRKSL